MSRRLILDNSPANLLCIQKPNSTPERELAREALEKQLIEEFPDRLIHVSMASAVELVDFVPAKRSTGESWFQKMRDSILGDDTKPLERSQRMADFYEKINTFYSSQSLGLGFSIKVDTCPFTSNYLSTRIQERLSLLRDSDLDRRLQLLYACNDLQQACGRKNKNSSELAAFQLFDALRRSDVFESNPSILRIVSSTLEIASEKIKGEQTPNAFNLGTNDDTLDCELASCAVIGSYSLDHWHTMDVVTFEKTPSHLARALGIKQFVWNWNAFVERNFSGQEFRDRKLTFRQGDIHYYRASKSFANPTVEIGPKFKVRDLTKRTLPVAIFLSKD